MRHRAPLIAVGCALALALAAWACSPDAPPTSNDARPATDSAATAAEGDAGRRERVRIRPSDSRPERPRVDPESIAPATTSPSAPAPGSVEPDDEGTETLELTLRNVEDGSPETSRVRLWRLGATTDADGAPLDTPHSTFHVSGTHRVGSLHPGRYRLEVWAGAKGSDDPPAFDVLAGARNEFVAEIVVPYAVEMRLRVYDERGTLVEHGSRKATGSGTTYSRPNAPPRWARVPAAGSRPGRISGGGGGVRSMRSGAPDTPVRAIDGRFALGAIRRAGRHFGWRRSYRFRFEGRNEVRVTARSRDPGDYVAVAVPLQPLADAVQLPDGRRAVDAGATITVTCQARAAGKDATGVWRTVPVSVTATLDGYERLAFQWTVDSGWPQPHTMERTPEPESESESESDPGTD